jgi:hypothetical protein
MSVNEHQMEQRQQMVNRDSSAEKDREKQCIDVDRGEKSMLQHYDFHPLQTQTSPLTSRFPPANENMEKRLKKSNRT